MRGPADSPYAGGEYHGTLVFPPQYPFSPPGIKVLTPSGRFQPDRKLCTSFSDFHAGSWNPAWTVSTILTGLLSFMLSDELTTGSIRSNESEKREFAKTSHAWNLYVQSLFSLYRSLPKVKGSVPFSSIERTLNSAQSFPSMRCQICKDYPIWVKQIWASRMPVYRHYRRIWVIRKDLLSRWRQHQLQVPLHRKFSPILLAWGLDHAHTGSLRTAATAYKRQSIARNQSTARRWLYGIGALVAAALFLRVVGV